MKDAVIIIGLLIIALAFIISLPSHSEEVSKSLVSKPSDDYTVWSLVR